MYKSFADIKISLDKIASHKSAAESAFTQMKSEAERLRLEKERQAGLERQAVLKEAENLHGPRRGHSGSGW